MSTGPQGQGHSAPEHAEEGDDLDKAPANTRATTFLSKESSVTLFDLGSREPTFVSIDEQAHLAAHLATLPKDSPNAGEPLVDSSGNFRHVEPRNVNVDPEQYYAQIKEGGTPLIRKDAGRIRRKISTGKLPTPAPTDLEPQLMIKDKSLPATEEENDEHREQVEEEDVEEETQDPSEDSQPEVFPTQVDEEVLEAAKKRQGELYEPAWMSRDDRVPTMVELVSERAEEHYQKGTKLEEQGDLEKAVQCFNKAINLKPKDIRFYVHRAEIFLILSDFQSAVLNYKRACVLDPENENFYNRLAFIYYFNGQCLFDQKLYPEALEAFSRATEMRPDVIGYHTRSIACLAALQRHGECLALVNKRLEVDQDNADLYIMRARLHQLFRNTTLCYYDVKDALALNPAHSEAKALMFQLQERSVELKQQATQLHLMGRHRDALQKVSMAIETNPSIADHHVIRGALHRRLGDFNAAIDDYLLALDKTNHNEESALYQQSQRQLLLTYNDFAVECFTKGYYEEAIILLNKAIKGEKREKGLYINRGDCFFKEGNLQFAMADYNQAQELDPADGSIRARTAVVHNEYGVQDFQDKTFQEAESRFTLAIQNNPQIANYYISRCRARQMMENMSAARQDILLALLLDPAHLELMPLVTRLFPGKSIKDIVQSKAALQARKVLDELIIEASPFKLGGLENRSKSMDLESDVPSIAVTKAHSAVLSESKTVWHTGSQPSLRACMEDRQFHIQIAAGKQKINRKVKDALQKRGDLRTAVGKVRPLPEAVPHTRSSGAIAKGPSADKVQVPQTTGWRNFGLGIGVPDVVK